MNAWLPPCRQPQVECCDVAFQGYASLRVLVTDLELPAGTYVVAGEFGDGGKE